MLFLQRKIVADNPSVWEEVDEYTFENYDMAVTGDGKPRYSGNRVSMKDGRIKVEASDLTVQDLGRIIRFCGGTERDVGSNLPVTNGGFVRKPEYVEFIIRKRHTIRCMSTGSNFKKDTPSKPAAPDPAEEIVSAH